MNEIIILIIVALAIIVYYNSATNQKTEHITNVKKPLTPYEILQYYPEDRLQTYLPNDYIINCDQGNCTVDKRMYIN
jgi:hypothetical protein